MDPTQVLKIIKFIKGKQSQGLMVENKTHAEPLAEVLFESAKLYNMLNTCSNLDEIVEQVSIKNAAAKKYTSITGKKWLF